MVNGELYSEKAVLTISVLVTSEVESTGKKNISVQKVITRLWTKMKNDQTCYLIFLEEQKQNLSLFNFSQIYIKAYIKFICKFLKLI